MECFQVRYDSRVVIYEHKLFIRLGTGSAITLLFVKGAAIFLFNFTSLSCRWNSFEKIFCSLLFLEGKITLLKSAPAMPTMTNLENYFLDWKTLARDRKRERVWMSEREKERDGRQMMRPENTLHRGKYHCTADLLFEWFGFDQTS